MIYNNNFSVKPTLKKVSKYENKFAKLQKKAAEFNFRNQLKVVKKKEFTLEEEDKEVRATHNSQLLSLHSLISEQKYSSNHILSLSSKYFISLYYITHTPHIFYSYEFLLSLIYILY